MKKLESWSRELAISIDMWKIWLCSIAVGIMTMSLIVVKESNQAITNLWCQKYCVVCCTIFCCLLYHCLLSVIALYSHHIWPILRKIIVAHYVISLGNYVISLGNYVSMQNSISDMTLVSIATVSKNRRRPGVVVFGRVYCIALFSVCSPVSWSQALTSPRHCCHRPLNMYHWNKKLWWGLLVG